MSSLPKPEQKSEDKVIEFFDNYFTEKLSFPSNDVDAVVSFFTKRGFDKSAAVSTATVLLTQAKLDKVKVFKLVDTLKGLTDVQLSALVTEVLNYNRPRTSTLGYSTPVLSKLEARNIKV